MTSNQPFHFLYLHYYLQLGMTIVVLVCGQWSKQEVSNVACELFFKLSFPKVEYAAHCSWVGLTHLCSPGQVLNVTTLSVWLLSPPPAFGTLAVKTGGLRKKSSRLMHTVYNITVWDNCQSFPSLLPHTLQKAGPQMEELETCQLFSEGHWENTGRKNEANTTVH